MALVTINGVSVISGDIMRPLVGVWTSDLVIDQPDGAGFDPGTKVTITSSNGYSLSGVVDQNRQGDFLDAVHVRVLGGAGGMKKPSSARSYVQPGAYVRDVLNGLRSDSGETLSGTISASLLGQNLAAWSILGTDPVDRNLRVLLDILGETTGNAYNWRILADGTLWVGAETWPVASATYDVLSQYPNDQSFHIGSESPFIVPGTNLDGVGHVARVQDTISDGKMRSRVWVDIPGIDRGINAATQQIARQAMAGVDFHALYLCEVVSQSADLTTVDINPVGDRNKKLIGGLQRVPVRFGTGIKVQVAPKSTVLLGWDGGNPEGPYVLGGLSGDTALGVQIAGNDPVITKADFQALIAAISGITYLPGPGAATALTFTVPLPTAYGSNTVGAGR